MRHGNLSVSTEENDIRDFLVTTLRIFTKSVFEKNDILFYNGFSNVSYRSVVF